MKNCETVGVVNVNQGSGLVKVQGPLQVVAQLKKPQLFPQKIQQKACLQSEGDCGSTALPLTKKVKRCDAAVQISKKMFNKESTMSPVLPANQHKSKFNVDSIKKITIVRIPTDPLSIVKPADPLATVVQMKSIGQKSG